MSYLLSVVVPTKNRYQYLYYLVNLIKGFNTSEIELVIQDNSEDNSEFNTYIAHNNDPWIKYYYCSDKLTSIQNFDLAIGHATGKFVTFIGDDDGVLRFILDCVRWMDDNNIEALRGLKTYYFWPEVGRNGGLATVERTKKIVEYKNPITELVKILKGGCDFLEDIPVLYTGIVKKSILDAIFNDYRTYFPGGASADIANGVALCFYVKRYCKINLPLVFTGTSRMTGGVQNRATPLNFAEVSFISEKVGKNWEGTFPQYWIGSLVWPESAIKSLRCLGKESFIPYLNYTRVIALYMRQTGFSLSTCANYVDNKNLLFNLYLSIILQRFIIRVVNTLIRLFSKGRRGLGIYRYSHLNNIIDAESLLVEKYNIDISLIKY